jgi:hypothetical protein
VLETVCNISFLSTVLECYPNYHLKKGMFKNMLKLKFTNVTKNSGDFLEAEQPAGCCVLSCRFSLSDAGADTARRLLDTSDTSVSKPLAAPEIISIDISDDESPNPETPDGAVAGNGGIRSTPACDSKQYPTVTAHIPAKRKATAAKTRAYENSHLNSVSTYN